LSGALAREEWKGDVRVEVDDDDYTLEVKYRSNGSGFSSLYDLISGLDAVFLLGPGMLVLTLNSWLDVVRRDETSDENYLNHLRVGRHEGGRGYSTLRKWIDGADFLAVRMPRSDWLIVQILPRKGSKSDV